jgi:hypothetical protein
VAAVVEHILWELVGQLVLAVAVLALAQLE